MAIKIYGGTYFGGEPVMDYTIEINGIGIKLSKEDFNELTAKLSDTIKQDYDKLVEVKKRHDNNVKRVQELRRDIIGLFWEGNQNEIDEIFFKRSANEIDEKKLHEVLDKYNCFLGFE